MIDGNNLTQFAHPKLKLKPIIIPVHDIDTVLNHDRQICEGEWWKLDIQAERSMCEERRWNHYFPW